MDITTGMNDAGACALGLRRCHERYANIRANYSLSSTQNLDSHRVEVNKLVSDDNAASTPKIANDFAREAAKTLSAEEFASLLAFLERPKGARNELKSHLHKTLAKQLEQFYESEVKESGQDRDRLARPGGPEDADLAIILHLQSEEDAIGAFWNPSSPTIQLLSEKGFDGRTVFGFDWHWRAEETFRGRTACPTLRWTQSLRALHDQMSHQVLEILPLPFVVTASSCAREGLRRTLGKEAKRIEIDVSPPIGILRFDLDYRHGFLRRIIVHVHHPAAGFFNSKQSRPAMAEQIDAGLDLFLWLTGETSQPNRFAQEYALKRPVSTRKAPLAEMYAYSRREREQGRLLSIEEYNPAFLSWVGRYLQEEPAIISLRGESIAAAAIKQMGQRISIARRKQVTKRSTKGRMFDDYHFHRKEVERSGDTSRLQQDRKAMSVVALSDLFAPKQQAASLEESFSNFKDDQLNIEASELDSKGQHVESRPFPIRLVAAQNHAPRRQAGREAFDCTQTPPISFKQSALSDTDESSDEWSDRESDEGVCEIEISEPMDNRKPDDDDDATANSEVDMQVDRINVYNFETLQGAQVVVQANGTVKLVGHYKDSPPRFRMGCKAAQDLMKLGKPPSIHFSPNEIHLKIDDCVVYRKPIERLLASSQGPYWLAQIRHEMEAMRDMRDMQACHEDEAQSPAEFQQFIVQKGAASTSAGSRWRNGELQRKLWQGGIMPCKLMKNGTAQGRLCVRGVQFLVPGDADFNTVSLKCVLAPEGTEHENKCALNLEKDDPAHRLGVILRYTSKKDQQSREIWSKLGGPCNTKKLNSLVDFLEGRDDDWTAQQPRRFLDRCKTKGRMKPAYTS